MAEEGTWGWGERLKVRETISSSLSRALFQFSQTHPAVWSCLNGVSPWCCIHQPSPKSNSPGTPREQLGTWPLGLTWGSLRYSRGGELPTGDKMNLQSQALGGEKRNPLGWVQTLWLPPVKRSLMIRTVPEGHLFSRCLLSVCSKCQALGRRHGRQ